MANFTFKPIKKQDLPLLLNWLTKPHISKKNEYSLSTSNFVIVEKQ